MQGLIRSLPYPVSKHSSTNSSAIEHREGKRAAAQHSTSMASCPLSLCKTQTWHSKAEVSVAGWKKLPLLTAIPEAVFLPSIPFFFDSHQRLNSNALPLPHFFHGRTQAQNPSSSSVSPPPCSTGQVLLSGHRPGFPGRLCLTWEPSLAPRPFPSRRRHGRMEGQAASSSFVPTGPEKRSACSYWHIWQQEAGTIIAEEGKEEEESATAAPVSTVCSTWAAQAATLPQSAGIAPPPLQCHNILLKSPY